MRNRLLGPVQQWGRIVTTHPKGMATREPDPSVIGRGLPSAVNLPVPPPPPPPLSKAKKGSNQTTPKQPAAEAETFLKAYAPTLLGEAMQRILDASFALATTPEVAAKPRQFFAAVNLPSAATMVAMIFLRSGTMTCQAAHGELSDADVIFLFHSLRPLLLLSELGIAIPNLNATTADKRCYLKELCRDERGQLLSLEEESLEAMEGFRLLAIYDKLNGCPLNSSGALTERMRHALLKYLHTLVDCDGRITDQELNCIEYLKTRSAECIQAGVDLAKQYPGAARRLRLSPFGKPVVVIDAYRLRENEQTGKKASVNDEIGEILRELQEMTGLASVKEEINSHINTLKVSSLRQKMGLAEIKTTNHMVFIGNPGTGKTTVARKLSRLYRELGILSSGSLTEVDQSFLVAGYVGQTAIKTKEVLDSAKGGVLFIDEAYALSSVKSENSFGKEAIDTLLKYMEDYRDDLIVIVAGYEQPMKNFLNSNPGLKSRFNKFIFFPDYNTQELKAIFASICQASGYAISDALDSFLTTAFTMMIQEKPDYFGNGRTVRNLFDCAVVRQANRIVGIQTPSHAQLMELTPADVTEEDIRKVLQ